MVTGCYDSIIGLGTLLTSSSFFFSSDYMLIELVLEVLN